MPLEQLTSIALEIYRRALTNRVRTIRNPWSPIVVRIRVAGGMSASGLPARSGGFN